MARERLDVEMVGRGLVSSREKARALIMAGRVYIKEAKADKPSQPVLPGDLITIRGELNPYVSRGGHKLKKAVEVFQLKVSGKVALDIGASTGGFTDVLLREGARRVYALDVGYGQLDYRLREDERVCVMERTNARHITPEMFDEKPDIGVTDVSFISLTKILPAAFSVVGPGRFIALIKPQFEAGRERVGKKGVVRDPAVHIGVISEIISFAGSLGWGVQGLDFSPITGPEGNIEFLADMVPLECVSALIDPNGTERVVRRAHDTLFKK